jgi:gas vesicle protein
MSDNNGGDVGAFLAGFIIGGLVGAATAMILAPKSGAELRAQLLSAGGEDFRAASQERVQAMRERAETYVESARDAGSNAQERVRIVLDEGKNRASDLGENISQRIRREDANGDAPEEA